MINQISLFEDSYNCCIDETSIWRSVEAIVNRFPDREEDLLPGLKWGMCTQLYTPAFWKLQYTLYRSSDDKTAHRLATSIVEEIVMCILGGYGIPSEMGIIAFDRLKAKNLIRRRTTFDEIYLALSSPFTLENGRIVHYRFFNQKSKYIFRLLSRDDLDSIPEDFDLELRNWLLSVDGIGLKTASWITRNWLKSEEVAILDIHLLRAGKLTGFFESEVLSNYLQQEREFLTFCKALGVNASDMDAIIWKYMKNNSKLALKTLFS